MEVERETILLRFDMKKSISKIISLLLALITFIMPVAYATAGLVKIGVNEVNEEETALLTFELISDTHVGADGTAQWFETGLNKIKDANLNADAIVIAGDLTDHGDADMIEKFYGILDANHPIPLDKIVCATGNHDMGQTASSIERRAAFIENRNSRMNIESDKLYYSVDVNGYKFIVMGSEGNGFNTCKISDEQFEFIDKELEAGAVDGKPVFVICHWPMRRNHGAQFLWPIWPGGNLNLATTNKLMSIMKKYNNVFYLSGHLHAGLNGKKTSWLFNACCVEDHEGITSVNSPSFGKNNRFGVAARATGMEFKVYGNKVVIIGRDYMNNITYDQYTFTINLATSDRS